MKYIEDTLPSMMHLPILSEDTLHFYRYLCTHMLIVDEQFLLLIDVPLQDCVQQIEIYEVFSLDIPHGNYSLHYDIGNKYLSITLDEIIVIEILEDQFQTYKRANGQFYILNAPVLPLANPPTCLSPLYTKKKNSIMKRCSLQVKKANSISIPTSIAPNAWIITSSPTAAPAGITLICPGEASRVIMPQTPVHILRLQSACSATSQHFHLPPQYKSHDVSINISLNTANLNVVNIPAPELRIWKHLKDIQNRASLQHLSNIPSVSFDNLYKQMITTNGPMNPFLSTDKTTRETVSVWTLFSHAGVYITAIEPLIPVGLEIFCCYFFWCQPA